MVGAEDIEPASLYNGRMRRILPRLLLVLSVLLLVVGACVIKTKPVRHRHDAVKVQPGHGHGHHKGHHKHAKHKKHKKH
jgi:hypothetical protein